MAIVLFMLFMEPLFLKFEGTPAGFSSGSHNFRGPQVFKQSNKEEGGNYVDDTKLVLIDDEELPNPKLLLQQLQLCGRHYNCQSYSTLSTRPM